MRLDNMTDKEEDKRKHGINNESHKVKVYLSRYVYTMLKSDASKNGESMSGYIKDCILSIHENSDLKTDKSDNQDKIDYHDLTVSLVRLGTNLNQISRKANQGLDINNDLRDFVDENSDKINDLLEEMSKIVDY